MEGTIQFWIDPEGWPRHENGNLSGRIIREAPNCGGHLEVESESGARFLVWRRNGGWHGGPILEDLKREAITAQ